jgi:competence protein ComGC
MNITPAIENIISQLEDGAVKAHNLGCVISGQARQYRLTQQYNKAYMANLQAEFYINIKHEMQRQQEYWKDTERLYKLLTII